MKHLFMTYGFLAPTGWNLAPPKRFAKGIGLAVTAAAGLAWVAGAQPQEGRTPVRT